MKILKGDISIDDRGSVRFVNDFNFENVKRFYQIENHCRGYVRAWHYHKQEGKYVYVAQGSALIGVVQPETEEINKYVLSSKSPKILWIPPGHANGFMSLEEKTIIMFFSTATIEETKNDDIRFPHDKWNIWQPNYR